MLLAMTPRCFHQPVVAKSKGQFRDNFGLHWLRLTSFRWVNHRQHHCLHVNLFRGTLWAQFGQGHPKEGFEYYRFHSVIQQKLPGNHVFLSGLIWFGDYFPVSTCDFILLVPTARYWSVPLKFTIPSPYTDPCAWHLNAYDYVWLAELGHPAVTRGFLCFGACPWEGQFRHQEHV